MTRRTRNPRTAAARDAQKVATRTRILDVARVHFEQHGFEVTNIRAIATDANVASGTVLLYFTDKIGLLHAALYDDLEQAIARCLSVRAKGPLLKCLSAVAGHFYAYYAERPTLSRTLLRESLFASSPWRERFEQQVARVLAHVAALVEQAKQQGEVAPTANTALMSAAFASFYYTALIGWVQGNLDNPLPLFEALMAQHLNGTKA